MQKSGWKCLDCWVNNKADVQKCVCCGGKKPVECDVAKKCSICKMSIGQSQGDKCTICEEMNIDKNIDNSFVPEQANDKRWKCKDCLVYNNEDEECVSCDENNPDEINSAALNKPDKIVESEWKCNDCWIKNKSSLSKCAACGGSKPGSQTNNNKNTGNNSLAKDSQGESKVQQTIDSTFSSIVKSQSEKWKCPLCLVRNESNRDTCSCCEASKPGTEKVTQKFNFHQPSEITFKFGIQPKSQEKCADIEPEECNMVEESETNNNFVPKTTFNFGLPINKSESNSVSMDKVPNANFTFGLPKVEPTPTAMNNIFGLPNKPIETSKSAEEKPQEVPQVFPPPQSDEDLKNLGLFNMSVKSNIAPEMPGLVPLQPNQNSAFKKDASFLNPSITTSSETKTQQNNFKFPSIRLASNLFAAVPTSTTAVSDTLPGPLSTNIPASTTVSMFQNPNIVITTASSFFQKSDAIPTLGVSMFPKTETPTTTATITTSSVAMGGTMQPIFSFGSQGTAPQAEQPKFSFNFSSNKSNPAIFIPFGGTSVSSIPNNKFNLPSNSIISGNALSGNPLNNNSTQMNPLTTGNSLSTTQGSSIFGATIPKENVWSSGTSNLFGANSTTNGDSQSQPFAFGTSAPFSANNASFSSSALQAQSNNPPFGTTTQTQPNNTPFGSSTQTQPNNIPFGSTTQQAQANNNTPFGSSGQQAQPNNTPFGSTAQQAQPNNVTFGTTSQQVQPNNAPFGSSTQPTQPTPAFGSTASQVQSSAAFGSTQPPQNVFGIANQTTTSQPTMFGNHLQSQATPNMFGGLQVSNNVMPMGMFGAPTPVAPTFGALNPSIPTFEPSTMPPQQPGPPSFNFGGQPSAGIFGFGQQQQQPGQVPTQPENPQGMYTFGGPQVAAPNVQFTIGSAPNTNVRRVRKAMRRTQR